MPGLGAEPSEPELVHLEVPSASRSCISRSACVVRRSGRSRRPRLALGGARPSAVPGSSSRHYGSARDGVEIAACARRLPPMLEPVMTMHEGRGSMRRAGGCCAPGAAPQPGLVAALDWLRRRRRLARTGARSAGPPRWSRVNAEVSSRGRPRRLRRPAGPSRRNRSARNAAALARRPLVRAGRHRRAAAVAPPLPADRSSSSSVARRRRRPETHTTNLVAGRRLRQCLRADNESRLGAGEWLPGLDLHLNSMLGEVDLLRGARARCACRA